jgi:hypothetical protein
MKKITSAPLKKPLTQFFLFILFMIAYNWPLLTIVEEMSPIYSFVFHYLLWFLSVIVLLLISLSVAHSLPSEDENKQG